MWLLRPSPLARLLRIFILGYRMAVSPLLGPRCRFEPSCSSYALDSLQEYGAVRGAALALWRVLRCQPFCRGGYDPVPPRRRLKSAGPTRDVSDPPGAPGVPSSGALRC